MSFVFNYNITLCKYSLHLYLSIISLPTCFASCLTISFIWKDTGKTYNLQNEGGRCLGFAIRGSIQLLICLQVALLRIKVANLQSKLRQHIWLTTRCHQFETCHPYTCIKFATTLYYKFQCFDCKGNKHIVIFTSSKIVWNIIIKYLNQRMFFLIKNK